LEAARRIYRRAFYAAPSPAVIRSAKLIHSLRRDGLKRGIVTLCIGGGQGIALAIETVH
jgi:acetyl-CoA C-acetyltransferase